MNEPMEIAVSCFPVSAARSSTFPDASNPVTEHMRTAVPHVTSSSMTRLRSRGESITDRNSSPMIDDTN